MPPSDTAVALEVEEITTADALDALRPEWQALWEQSPGATPFEAPAWLGPWWRAFGKQPGWELWTLALRDEDRLVGLAPFFLHPGPDGQRQISPLGIGITDYHGILLEPGMAAEGITRCFAHLREHRERWDVCDLEQLRADSPLLAAPIPPGLRAEAFPQEICPVVTLSDDAEAFRAALPAWLRRNLRRGARRLGERGELRFELADATTLPEWLDAFVRLHEARADDAGRSGLTEGERAVGCFLREAAREMLAAGTLRLHGMRLGGEPVAVLYALVARGRVYAYQSGFHPALGRDSPGTLIVGHGVEMAIREGMREWDWLRGAESYKYDWGAKDRQTFRLCLRQAGG